MNPTLPLPPDISKTLSMLVFRDVNVSETTLPFIGSKTVGALGLYQTPSADFQALCYMEISLAAGAGAALGLFSPDIARSAALTGRIDDNIRDVVHEIFNICSRLFDSPGIPALVLQSVCFAPPVTPDILQLLPSFVLKRAYEASIDGYTKGRLALLIQKPKP